MISVFWEPDSRRKGSFKIQFWQIFEGNYYGRANMLLAEPLADRGIGLPVEVHRHTGSERLESVYELCLI
jgi:hypothetical protein